MPEHLYTHIQSMIKYLFNDIKVNRKITVRKAENPNIKKLKGKKKNEEKKKVL